MKSEAEKEADREFFRANGMDANEERMASAWFLGALVIALAVAAVAFLSWLIGLFVTCLIIFAFFGVVVAFVWWLTGH